MPSDPTPTVPREAVEAMAQRLVVNEQGPDWVGRWEQFCVSHPKSADAFRRDACRHIEVALPVLREQIQAEIAERVKAELYPHPRAPMSMLVGGPLGDALSESTGSRETRRMHPNDMAEGIANWLTANKEGTEDE